MVFAFEWFRFRLFQSVSFTTYSGRRTGPTLEHLYCIGRLFQKWMTKSVPQIMPSSLKTFVWHRSDAYLCFFAQRPKTATWLKVVVPLLSRQNFWYTATASHKNWDQARWKVPPRNQSALPGIVVLGCQGHKSFGLDWQRSCSVDLCRATMLEEFYS